MLAEDINGLIGCQTSNLCQSKFTVAPTVTYLLPPEEPWIPSDVIADKDARVTTDRKDGV